MKHELTTLKVVDLFCGCGGLSTGINKSRVAEAVFAYDNWAEAVSCYKENVDNHVKKADLSKPEMVIPDIKDLAPDIIAGGTPCQDFSVAGAQEEGDKANLTRCFADIVVAVQPKWFFLENVPKIKTSKAYKYAKRSFIERGYGLTEVVVNAMHYGVPQTRKRFICIGGLAEDHGFMEQDIIAAANEAPMTVRQFFKNNRWALNYEHFFIHPRNYDRKAIFSVDETAPTIRGQSRPMSANYKEHPRDAASRNEAEILNAEQRARLQGFPPKFKFSDRRKSVRELMIGNAVPVDLAANLFTYIAQYARFNHSNAGRKPNIESIFGVERGVYVRWLCNKKSYQFEHAKDMWSLLARAWKEGLEGILTPDMDKLAAIEEAQKFLKSSKMRKDQISRTKKAISLFYEIRHKLR